MSDRLITVDHRPLMQAGTSEERPAFIRRAKYGQNPLQRSNPVPGKRRRGDAGSTRNNFEWRTAKMRLRGFSIEPYLTPWRPRFELGGTERIILEKKIGDRILQPDPTLFADPSEWLLQTGDALLAQGQPVVFCQHFRRGNVGA